MSDQYTYNSLRDEACDDQHNYHSRYVEWYEPCGGCGKPDRYACVLCEKVTCGKCLYNIHLRELHEDNPRMIYDPDAEEHVRANIDYEYGQVCLACYIKHEKHPPYSWGWINYRFASWAAPQGEAIEKGSCTPAGDGHSWMSDPRATKVVDLHSRPGFKPSAFDAFDLKSFLAWLKAWESQLDQVAAFLASTSLVEYHNKVHAANLRADAGIIDYSQYE